MEEAAEDRGKMTSQQALCDPDEKTSKRPGISTLKVLKLCVIKTLLLGTRNSVFLHRLNFILLMRSRRKHVTNLKR